MKITLAQGTKNLQCLTIRDRRCLVTQSDYRQASFDFIYMLSPAYTSIRRPNIHNLVLRAMEEEADTEIF